MDEIRIGSWRSYNKQRKQKTEKMNDEKSEKTRRSEEKKNASLDVPGDGCYRRWSSAISCIAVRECRRLQ